MLAPIAAVQAAILDSFGQMLARDAFGSGEICDGAGYFEDSVVSACRQAHPANSHFEGPFSGIVKGAEGSQLPCRNLGIVKAADVLNLAGTVDSFTHLGGGDAILVGPEFLIGNGRNLDVEVDSV